MHLYKSFSGSYGQANVYYEIHIEWLNDLYLVALFGHQRHLST